MHHSRTKHIEIRHHFIREQVSNGVCKIKFIESEKQLVDFFTNLLAKLVESEYFFSSELDVQREKTNEPPSWLSSLSCPKTVPKEQVDRANEHVSVNV